jgi:flagellar hook-associated protein 1 FlgK
VPSILSTGVSALTAYQRALATVGHNVANADTEGYSRQVVQFTARVPSYSGGGWIGSGVEIGTVQRRYDGFLADQVRTGLTGSGEADVYHTYARQLDDLYADAELGLDPMLQRFFGAWNSVANDPTSVPAREVLLAEAEALVDRFGFLAGRAAEITDGVNRDIEGVVADVNTLARGIAELNDAIVKSGGGDGATPANDLLDQRDQLVNRLSSLVRVTYYAQDDGALNVFIGNGQSLVVGSTAAALDVGIDPSDVTRRIISYQGQLGSQDVTAQLSGGALGGLLKVRTDVIDPSVARLDDLAVGLAAEVNARHVAGTALDGSTGRAFFTVSAGAADIAVAIDDARLVAAGQGAGPSDNRNALELAALQRAKVMLGNTATLQGAYGQIVAGVGARTRHAGLNAEAQQGLVQQAQAAHSAVSGVNLDEEAANLMHYQQAYQAAAQVIAVAGTLFDTLIAAFRR